MQFYSLLIISLVIKTSGGYKVYSIEEDLSPRPRREVKEASLYETLSSNVTRILEDLLQNYDKTERPDLKSGKATKVDVNMFIRSMGPISEADMYYSMDCYFRQYWTDTRLSFKGLESSSNQLEINQLSLNVKMLEKIWKPDTYFHNGLDSYLHTITRPNKLLRISEHGFITYSMRLTIKAKCPMMLSSFPMDWQACPLILGSFAYPESEVRYTWQDPSKGVVYEGELQLSQFDIRKTEYRNLNFTRTGSGTYSVLQIVFLLQRHTGYFLIQVYVPCTLIVVLSWVGFWLNREATSDRVGLGITAVLTLSTIALDSRTDLPKVHYATALDWFIICSFGYCMATLLEFAGVHYFTKVGSGEVFFIAPMEDERDDSSQDIAMIEPALNAVNKMYSLYNQDNDFSQESFDSMTELQLRSSCQIHNNIAYTQMNHVNGRSQHAVSPSSYSVQESGSMVSSSRPVSTQTEPKPSYFSQLLLCLLSNQDYRKEREREATRRGVTVNSVSRIDIVSRFLFPFSFLCFNILYWMSYFQGQIPFDWSQHEL